MLYKLKDLWDYAWDALTDFWIPWPMELLIMVIAFIAGCIIAHLR